MENNYYLYCVILKNCPYSQAAYELLNLKKNIKKEFTFINRSEMDNYKTEFINTFPQIYLKRYNTNGTKLIGGYTELKNIFDKFENDIDKKNIKIFLENNISWNKKSLLRLIELIN
jgi:glutaredoxin